MKIFLNAITMTSTINPDLLAWGLWFKDAVDETTKKMSVTYLDCERKLSEKLDSIYEEATRVDDLKPIPVVRRDYECETGRYMKVAIDSVQETRENTSNDPCNLEEWIVVDKNYY
jgi:hypothetical protein